MPQTPLNPPVVSSTSQTRAEPPPVDQSQLLQLVGYSCRRAYLHVLGSFGERMEPLNLRPVEYSVLVLVAANPEINQKRLGRVLAIDPPNMATLLDRLEARDLLRREPDPDDKRARFLTLTTAGKRLCAKAEKLVRDSELEATSALTETDRAELTRLLQKIFLR